MKAIVSVGLALAAALVIVTKATAVRSHVRELKEHFESGLPQDVELYNEYHALLVEVGKEHCRKKPRCEGCPLADLLPPGGPQEPEG